jgi:hypothetical protein
LNPENPGKLNSNKTPIRYSQTLSRLELFNYDNIDVNTTSDLMHFLLIEQA